MTTDFEYDGMRLSDFGFMVCEFSGGGTKTEGDIPSINFTTTPMLNGNKWLNASAKYDSCLTATFNICKIPYPDGYSDTKYITTDEEATLSRWLCRKTMHKFKLLMEGYEQVYFEGSFSIERVTLGGRIIGFSLILTTNRPFALYEPCVKELNFHNSGETITFHDISDELGHIYVRAEITCGDNGRLTIHNSMENRDTAIDNCTIGEVITLDYPSICSSIPSHRIQDDFNFRFLRIANSWGNRDNHLTASMPCTVKLSYSPVKKVGT